MTWMVVLPCWPGSARLGQQRPDAVRKRVALLPPRVKALLVPEEFLKRTAPGSAGISGIGHDIGW
jgi:hypothetical protein